ncbi:MAG TPA: hypothetical protein VFF69_07495 [Phycisphaerales bacterium]|nr:hypothetical protein [Phycisphaerales bacterium]
MKKLAPIAALLVAAAGALAQSDCQSHCSKAKDGATVEQVAHQTAAKNCEGKTGCEAATAAASLVAHQPAADCEGKTGCEGEQAAGLQMVSFPSDMPAMHFVVGDKETCCPEEASQLVSAGGSQMQYKVANVTYTDQAEAGKAYAAELEHYLDRMTRVSFVVGEDCCCCPFEAEKLSESSGQPVKYKVGNTVFECPEKAIRAAALAYGQAQQVKMSYAIDGQPTECQETFAKAKSCTTTKAAYLVAGKETQCEVEAACLLVTARIEAALAAAAQLAQG